MALTVIYTVLNKTVNDLIFTASPTLTPRSRQSMERAGALLVSTSTCRQTFQGQEVSMHLHQMATMPNMAYMAPPKSRELTDRGGSGEAHAIVHPAY